MCDIEVMCLYCSASGRIVTYNDLCRGLDYMDMEDRVLDSFWSTFGGFSITLEGYKTIFRSIEFYNMTKALTFLINSLYWALEKKSDWSEDSIDISKMSIIMGENEFWVKKKGLYDISISYKSLNSQAENIRGQYFFEDVVINKSSWINALNVALNEYFTILRKILEQNVKQHSVYRSYMLDFYKLWENVRIF
ncbi:hypothetical protein [Polluticaenibacter yanchengensis]|uniref:Uncharacterized protein n=1 Tax=Polluticaenibacter yanchengensis TaxID=3014562 RepID=A0ABT4UNC2_9BACT|nr:hypothetical protein [Chitinophagaceae bacterium LY-5]